MPPPRTLSRRAWLQRTLGAGVGLASLPLLGRSQLSLAGSPGFGTAAEAEPSGLLRLNFNENPFGPPPSVRSALQTTIDNLARYEFNLARTLRERLAALHGVTTEQVLLGAGSSELLGLCVLAYGTGGEIVSGYPTYQTQLQQFDQLMQGRWQRVPLRDDLHLDLDAMRRAVGGNTRLVYLCNPNNPTGTVHPADALREFVSAVLPQAPVIVDEAYMEYADPARTASLVDLVRAGQQVGVLKTFSKAYGMAGIRLGYLVASPQIVQQVAKWQVWRAVCVSQTAMAAGLAALDAPAQQHVRMSVQENANARERFVADCARMGLSAHPSQTSFVAVPLSPAHADLRARLEARGVLVSGFQINERPYLRVTMGTPSDMQRLSTELRQLLA